MRKILLISLVLILALQVTGAKAYVNVTVTPPIPDFSKDLYQEFKDFYKGKDATITVKYKDKAGDPEKTDILTISPLVAECSYLECIYNITYAGDEPIDKKNDLKFKADKDLAPYTWEEGDSLMIKYIADEPDSFFKFNVTLKFDGKEYTLDPYAVTDSTNFNGTYYQTFLNESGHIQLNLTAGYTSGYFTQNVFDAGEVVHWDNISYQYGDLYGEKLTIQDNIRLYYQLDNNATKGESNSAYFDESEYSNWGSCTNCPLLITTSHGKGREFDGVNDVITVANESLFDFEITDSFSVGFWVYLDARDLQGLVGKRDSLGKGWYVGTYANDWSFGMRDDAGEQRRVLSQASATLSSWIYMLFTYNGSAGRRMSLYQNGLSIPVNQDQNDTALTSILNNNPVQLGANGNSQNFADARLDEVSIWFYELTSAQALQTYLDYAGMMNISVRSCDDLLCAGEPWAQTLINTPSPLSLSDNRYFQYNITFATASLSYSPKVTNVSVHYSPTTTSTTLTSTTSSTVSTTTTSTSTSTSSTTTSTYNVNLSVNLQISTYGDGAFDLEICNHIDGCTTYSGNETVTLPATRDPFIKLINPVVDTDGLGIIRFFTGRLEGFIAVIFVLIIAFMLLIYGVSLATAK